MGKNWQERFIHLRPKVIEWRRSEYDAHPSGVLPIRATTTVNIDRTHPHCLAVIHGEEKLVIKCANMRDMSVWSDAIQRAINHATAGPCSTQHGQVRLRSTAVPVVI